VGRTDRGAGGPGEYGEFPEAEDAEIEPDPHDEDGPNTRTESEDESAENREAPIRRKLLGEQRRNDGVARADEQERDHEERSKDTLAQDWEQDGGVDKPQPATDREEVPMV
jgi:hypothetical protein